VVQNQPIFDKKTGEHLRGLISITANNQSVCGLTEETSAICFGGSAEGQLGK